jgi:hypothetical protein
MEVENHALITIKSFYKEKYKTRSYPCTQLGTMLCRHIEQQKSYFVAFLTSALDRQERPASGPCRFIPLCYRQEAGWTLEPRVDLERKTLVDLMFSQWLAQNVPDVKSCTRSDNKVREPASVCLPWTETSVWFNDVGI